MNSSRSAGHRTGDAVGGVDVEEGDPVAEVVAVAVAGVERAVVGRDLGVDMRRVLLTQVAEHPFDVAGGGEAAAARAVVAQHQARELHRIVERDEYRQLAVHRRLVVLEHAIAEAVAGAVRRCGLVVARVARGRPRGRRPDLAAVLVAQEDFLAAGVGHRVVVPGREPQLMGVLAPGVGAAGLRHDRAEARVGDDVDPGRGRPMHAVGGDHVLTPVGREAANAVEERQRAGVLTRRRRHGGLGRARGLERRRPALGDPPGRHLLRERAEAIADDRPSHRLQQHAILSGDVLGVADEDAARAVDHVRFEAARDQAEDLLLQPLAIDVALLVPDHQVDGQALEPPPGMRLHHLPHEVDAARIADLQQHDRQVTRDRIAPQPRLPAPVAQQHLRIGAQRRLRVDDGVGKARIGLRIGLAGVELAQDHLTVRPGELEHPVRQAPVHHLVRQHQAGLAAVGRAVDDVDERSLVGLQRDHSSGSRHRVEYRSRRAGQRRSVTHRRRRMRPAAAADEARAVGLV